MLPWYENALICIAFVSFVPVLKAHLYPTVFEMFFIFESLHCALLKIIQLRGCPIRKSCSTTLNAFRWRNRSVPLINGTTKIKLQFQIIL